MRRKRLLCMGGVLLLLGSMAVGCGRQEEEKEDLTIENTDQEGAEEDEILSSSDQSVAYVPNETADGYDLVELDGAVTPEALLNLLKERGVVSAETSILQLQKTTVDGESAIDLDLSQEFLQYLSTQGTTGEGMIIGSVTNTFLSAYDCDKLKITVEGQPLQTEHGDYSDYMRKS